MSEYSNDSRWKSVRKSRIKIIFSLPLFGSLPASHRNDINPQIGVNIRILSTLEALGYCNLSGKVK